MKSDNCPEKEDAIKEWWSNLVEIIFIISLFVLTFLI